ncbi:VWA domain-containing protein [Escherichia coli]|nr:VWA domain-containing protein [Escherichia coli]
MSELNDLLTTRELQRWRLILGEAAETTLCGLDDNARQIDHALEWLYGRDPERLQRGERSGGLGGSNLTTPEWINSIHTLFPQQVIERLESDAVLRYGIEDVVTNLDVLERMQPSESLLRAVLHTKHLMNPEVLAAARQIVRQVVEEIMARLAKEVRQAFSGVRDRRRRSLIPLARNFDFKSTLRANLQHWHPQHGKLYIESPRFNSRIKRQSEQWQLVLLVDQSGSMVDSVIHSAVMAACLWQLPGIRTHLVAFDTSVVDLTADVADPVELLMKVQLGGGTNIASAVEYGRQLIEQPAKSVIILVSDFYEGGSSSLLTHQVKKCVQSGIKVLGLAALDSTATPCYDRDTAQALVAKGITIELFCAPGEIPSARLPMSDVRFYSRSSIRFARCDCIEGTLCEHVVLAVQAFVEAKAQQAEFNHLIWQMRSEHVTSSDDPFASEEGQTCRQYVQQLSQALWLGGISQPLIHYEAAFNRTLQAAEACNWRWVSESLRQLRASVDAFHTRASHYHAVECLRQLAALNSRLNCAQEMARRDSVGEVPPVPWRTVVGSGIAGEAKLDHLRLVSLGMRCWQDIEHYGLRIWFTDPDTGSILHLSRSWPRSEQENSPAATRRLFSFQAGALAGGQIVSQAAKRSADGELLLATRNRLSSVVPLSPDAWQMLSAPLRQPGIVALREYLRQRPPACIRPLNQVDNLFILPVAECISLGWDSSRQTLDAQVISGEGEDNLLTLSLPASACSPFAVERMAALLQQTDDPVSLVSGFVSFVDGQLTLEPRVMMTKTRAWALDAETAPVAPLPSASVLPVPSTAHQLLMRCQALLIQLLHNGWRYQEQSAISQAELLANDLSAVGFYRLAHVLGQFRNTESEARVEAMNNGVLLCEQLFPMLQQQG